MKTISVEMKRFQKISCIWALLLCSATLMAQNIMRVHYKDGTNLDIAISEVDSVSFVDKETPEESLSLTGEWLWGNIHAGYYELLTFNEDFTYTGYDNYFTYGFDTMTYGWYSWYSSMLTLQSNGFGYQRVYRWFITGLTGNALEVMTKTGPFTYYRLQPEVITISQSEPWQGLAEGDTIVFADGVVAKAEEDKLLGLQQGTTYILVKKAVDEKILAYKVVVKV